MVTFIILLKVKRKKINEVAEQMAEMPEISEVYSVTGIYDLVAIVRTRSNDDVADLVADKLGPIKGINLVKRNRLKPLTWRAALVPMLAPGDTARTVMRSCILSANSATHQVENNLVVAYWRMPSKGTSPSPRAKCIMASNMSVLNSTGSDFAKS